jgi:hypothetical protein
MPRQRQQAGVLRRSRGSRPCTDLREQGDRPAQVVIEIGVEGLGRRFGLVASGNCRAMPGSAG